MSGLARALVAGLGNPFRGDDGVGRRVAQAVQERELPGVTVVELGDDLLPLLEIWRGFDTAILVDALAGGEATPGTVHRCDASREPLLASPDAVSSHALGLPQIIELGRRLNNVPPVIMVYGVSGQNFAFGGELSPAVAAAVKATADLIEQALTRLLALTEAESA